MNGVLRTRTAVALTTAALSVGVALVAAPSATAAGSAYFCFSYDMGAAYAEQPVQLYANGVKVREGRTASDGCATFYRLSPDTSYAVRASVVLGDSAIGWRVYDGWSQYQTGTGYGPVDIGRGVAQFVDCIPGANGSCY